MKRVGWISGRDSSIGTLKKGFYKRECSAAVTLEHLRDRVSSPHNQRLTTSKNLREVEEWVQSTSQRCIWERRKKCFWKQVVPGLWCSPAPPQPHPHKKLGTTSSSVTPARDLDGHWSRGEEKPMVVSTESLRVLGQETALQGNRCRGGLGSPGGHGEELTHSPGGQWAAHKALLKGMPGQRVLREWVSKSSPSLNPLS